MGMGMGMEMVLGSRGMVGKRGGGGGGVHWGMVSWRWILGVEISVVMLRAIHVMVWVAITER